MLKSQGPSNEDEHIAVIITEARPLD